MLVRRMVSQENKLFRMRRNLTESVNTIDFTIKVLGSLKKRLAKDKLKTQKAITRLNTYLNHNRKGKKQQQLAIKDVTQLLAIRDRWAIASKQVDRLMVG